MKSVKETEKEFFECEIKYLDLVEQGDIDGAFKLMRKTWDNFQEPKVSQDLCYLLVEDFIKICIETKKFELANKYISLLFVTGLKRVDYGDKEFWAGKLAYEQGELEVAKELFTIANIKSEGDLFKGKENKKYRDLIK